MLPLARRPVGHVRGDLPLVQRGVRALHRAVDELLDEPRIRLGGMAVARLQMPRQRTRVGEQPDAAAREGGPGEVRRESPDRVGELVLAVGEDGLRRTDLEPVAELLKGPLVVYLGQRPERRRVQLRHRRKALVLGGQVEDLLEHRQDHLDLVLRGDPLDVGGKSRRVARGRRGHEVPRQVPGVVPRRRLVAVRGIDLVAALAELADRVQRERHPRAGDQHPHRGRTLRAPRGRRLAAVLPLVPLLHLAASAAGAGSRGPVRRPATAIIEPTQGG